MVKRLFFLGICLISVFLVKNGFCAGSGAFRVEVPDAEALGKGSAFVAQADNPSAIYYNPAGLTQLKGKLNVSLGATAIQPFTTYKDNSGNETDMRRQVFTIPSGYVVSNFGLEKFAFGIGATSYWGLGTYWAEDSFSRYVATKSDYSTQDIMFTGAYAINDNLSVGISADYTKSNVNKKKKLLQGGTGDDGDFQLKGKDDSAWGYRLSTLYKVNNRHSFGFMYRSPVEVKYKGKVYLNDLNGTPPVGSVLPVGYSTIFGGSSYETDITSKSTLPQSILIGYCYKPDDKWRFEFDAEWMDWSSIKDEKIDYPSGYGADPVGLASTVLNDGNPASKNYHSVFSYALGTEYKVNDILKLRAGYFFHKTPIPQATFNTNLPDATSNSITLGLGINLNKNTTLDFAYAAMFFDKRKINNAVGSGTINGTYRTFTNLYALTLTFKI
ncbi:MAG: outer membrane protein transport protein [Candidatus Omnitrophica bacterium]|nr:outer membrane protein transport protein [Candidatus Omnitrophota bacterium]